jgi:hypothetical protein
VAFRGHDSRLRHRTTLASCASGGHAIWWAVEAASDIARDRALDAFHHPFVYAAERYEPSPKRRWGLATSRYTSPTDVISASTSGAAHTW